MLHTFVALVQDKLGAFARTQHRHTDNPHEPLSVLKARATLAWGNAPGARPTTNCGLKARAKYPTHHPPTTTFSKPRRTNESDLDWQV
jgi:hypothetical protein